MIIMVTNGIFADGCAVYSLRSSTSGYVLRDPRPINAESKPIRADVPETRNPGKVIPILKPEQAQRQFDNLKGSRRKVALHLGCLHSEKPELQEAMPAELHKWTLRLAQSRPDVISKHFMEKIRKGTWTKYAGQIRNMGLTPELLAYCYFRWKSSCVAP
jgi:hypothetical protein